MHFISAVAGHWVHTSAPFIQWPGRGRAVQIGANAIRLCCALALNPPHAKRWQPCWVDSMHANAQFSEACCEPVLAEMMCIQGFLSSLRGGLQSPRLRGCRCVAGRVWIGQALARTKCSFTRCWALWPRSGYGPDVGLACGGTLYLQTCCLLQTCLAINCRILMQENVVVSTLGGSLLHLPTISSQRMPRASPSCNFHFKLVVAHCNFDHKGL